MASSSSCIKVATLRNLLRRFHNLQGVRCGVHTSHSFRTFSVSSACSSSRFTLAHPSVQKYLKSVGKDPTNLGLSRVVNAIVEKQNEVRELVLMGEENADLKDIAEADAAKVKLILQTLENEFFDLVIPVDRMDGCQDVIIEVSAGVGGQEAMLFSKELLDMYAGFAEFRGWQCEVVELGETELGGLRRGSLAVSGPRAYKTLKFEGGVHRVQRVPKTEKAGRIHTSTSTVAVLPMPGEIDVRINPQDLVVETKRSSGAGGQHVNKTESAVRITHVPSGIVVESQTDRSQVKNRSNAMKALRAKLYQREANKVTIQMKSSRKLQVGLGGRNEKIRTYNYVQDRVTDHRIGLSVHNLKGVLEGYEAFDEIVGRLEEFDKNERLNEMFQ